jgi:hypothetical protein
MFEPWQVILLSFLTTFTQILIAGIAITAFSLLLYALTFNLRDRVARSFAVILICVVIVFTADALGSTTEQSWEVELWLKLQWVGIILLPAAYLHFSDALLATTGKVSRGKRRWAVRFSYLISALFLIGLGFDSFVGKVVVDGAPAPYLEPTSLTAAFLIYYVILMGLAWYNFYRSYQRTTNSTSRRRMAYLLTGAAAPALGSFPFLLFGSGFAALHHILFWMVAFLSNMLVGVLMVVMAYAVAFFGVSWPDRVVKARLFKWLMRGPITASITLGLTTIIRRLSEGYGLGYSALVPITMAGSVVMLEFLITLFSPLGERFLFDGNDRAELELLRTLEDRLLTQNDLAQFLEMVLAAVSDRMQAEGAYLIAQNGDGLEFVVKTGQLAAPTAQEVQELAAFIPKNGLAAAFSWRDFQVLPMLNEDSVQKELLGLLVVSSSETFLQESEQQQAIRILTHRITIALRDRKVQHQVFQSLMEITPDVDLIQNLRAASRYNDAKLLESVELSEGELVQWVKDALTHYWGGPKLTESPLIQFKIVQEAVPLHEDNPSNALRAVLREAIERVKPEGEKRYTSEWILYNILDMKFMDGRKVREIAMRLAVSEADLYRKQRIAIEAVARIIIEMENQAREQEKSKKIITGQN